jgi:hypothetical protein
VSEPITACRPPSLFVIPPFFSNIFSPSSLPSVGGTLFTSSFFPFTLIILLFCLYGRWGEIRGYSPSLRGQYLIFFPFVYSFSFFCQISPLLPPHPLSHKSRFGRRKRKRKRRRRMRRKARGRTSWTSRRRRTPSQ